MSTAGKLLIAGIIVLLAGAGVALNRYLERSDDPTLDVERIERRTLEAVVSASGTIEPQLSVDISSSVMGRVTRLDINEGDRVAAGQFLLEIDPESLQAAVYRNEASLAAAESSLEQARVAVETARVNLALAQDTLERQTELWELELISREEFDAARRELELRETEFEARQVEVATASQRAGTRHARQRGVRPGAGDDNVSDRRRGDAPQHRGRRNGGHRHDEQPRHRVDDHCGLLDSRSPR